MLVLGIGQVVLALLLCIAMITQSSGGHDELKYFRSARMPAQDVGWVYHVAWQFSELPGPCTLTAWLAGSIAMTLGAITLDPRIRRRCYQLGASIVLGGIAIILIALFLLDDSRISYRWVHPATGQADPWHEIVIEPSFYWQFSAIALIVNPTLILSALRMFTARADDVFANGEKTTRSS